MADFSHYDYVDDYDFDDYHYDYVDDYDFDDYHYDYVDDYDYHYDCNSDYDFDFDDYKKSAEKEKLFYIFDKISCELRENSETYLNSMLSHNNELARMTFRMQETLLHLVAKFGSLNAAERLIQLGANINESDISGETTLSLAIEYRPDMVTFLLSQGADANIALKDGSTLLRRALIWGSTQIVEQLLNKMYDNYLSGENGETPNDVETCEIKALTHLLKQERHLISREINQKYERDEKQMLLDILHKRFISPEIPLKTYEDDVPKCRKIVEFILKQKIDVNLSDDKYSYLLRFVLKYGDEDTFNLVLQEDKNIDLNARGVYGIPLLHLFIHDDKDEAYLKRLVDQGVDFNVEGLDDFTALHYAVRENNSAFVRYILSHGADPNKKTIHDFMPLHFAIFNGNKKIIKMLLNTGADIKVQIHLSSKENLIRKEFIFKKISHDPKDNCLSPLGIACQMGRMDLVELIWNYGEDVQYNYNSEEILLHHALAGGNMDIIDFLIKKGIDINKKDLLDRSPLYFIISRAHSKKGIFNKDEIFKKCLLGPMIEFLVDNGADVDTDCLQKGVFITVLQKALKIDLPEVVECLLELKADVKDKNNYYKPLIIDVDCKSNCSGRVLVAFMATTEVDIRLLHCREFFYACRIEVGRLKNRTICDDRMITLFDFLTRDLKEVTEVFDIYKLLEALEVFNYKDEFPCYAFLLEKRIERVKAISLFKDSIVKFIEDLAEVKLPLLVWDHMFSFWRIGDIRNFARALSLVLIPPKEI